MTYKPTGTRLARGLGLFDMIITAWLWNDPFGHQL